MRTLTVMMTFLSPTVIILADAPATLGTKSYSTIKDVKQADIITAKPKNIGQIVATGKSNLTIRFVESFDTMRQCDSGIECGKILQEKQKQLSEAIQKDEKEITEAMTTFQAKAPTLSAEAREREEKKLRKMKTEYDTKLQESEYEMKLAMQKVTEDLAAEMEKTVAEYAKREKIDAVVDTGTGRVLYASQSLKITDAVVKEMNSKRQEKLAANNKSDRTDKTLAAAQSSKQHA